MKIFIDTEFTNFDNMKLISIGLISENNQTFYRESRNYILNDCSDFVIEHIIPLLNSYKDKTFVKQETQDIAKEMLNWLTEINPQEEIIEIVADYKGDWKLFNQLLDLVSHKLKIKFVDIMDLLVKEILKKEEESHLNSEQMNLLAGHTQMRFATSFEDWFKKNKKIQHHALDDTIANKYAFDKAIELIKEWKND